jgi:hypothetical protein
MIVDGYIEPVYAYELYFISFNTLLETLNVFLLFLIDRVWNNKYVDFVWTTSNKILKLETMAFTHMAFISTCMIFDILISE